MTDDLRERLLAAAGRLLDTDGIDSVTIREVARTCGVSHGAPRRHFATRAELLGDVAFRVVHELSAELATTDQSPYELAVAYVAFAQRRPHAFALMTRHDLLEGSGANLRPSTRALLMTWKGAWGSIPGHTERSALATFAGVHGVAALAAQRATDALEISPGLLLDAVLER